MRLAARGTRETAAGEEPVGDPGERRVLRSRAARIHAVAVASAAALAAAGALAPWLACASR